MPNYSLTAESSASRALLGAIDLIASTQAFQNRIALGHGVPADKANALEHIFIVELQAIAGEDDLQQRRPFCAVAIGEHEYRSVSTCTYHNLLPDGNVMVQMEDLARQTNTGFLNDPYLDFYNFSYNVFDNIQFGGDGFPFNGIDTVEPVNRTPPKNRGGSEDVFRVIKAFVHQSEDGGSGT